MTLHSRETDEGCSGDYILMCLCCCNAVGFFRTAEAAIEHCDEGHVVVGPDDFFYDERDGHA